MKSPVKILATTVAIVAVCEAITMVILHYLGVKPSLEILVDPIILSILASPLLYLALLNPLRNALSDQVRCQTLAQEARLEAEAATQAKSRFLSHLSHEIRTPVSGSSGMASLLLQTDMSPDQREFAESIEICNKQLLSLVNDVLDFAKIESGKLELEETAFELEQVVSEACRIVLSSGDPSIEFFCHISPEIPRRLSGDPLRLRQVIINLTGNAFKFARGGSVDLNIELLASGESQVEIKCSVTDNGPGIPREKLDLLFQEFSQVGGAANQNTVGTGLGLAISKQLAELMGGRIGVESTLGRGSTFWFTARLNQASPSLSMPDPSSEIPQPVANQVPRGARILLADDNPINRRFTELYLERHFGAKVTTAADGWEVLDLLSSGFFDVVLMDMEMPGLDGLETTRRIRGGESGARNPNIPVIALSAHAVKDRIEQCLAAGMEDFVAKPIDTEHLAQVLEKHLARVDV